MHLVVDVGNTETAIGLLETEELEIGTSWRVSTAVSRTGDEWRLLLGSLLAETEAPAIERVTVASVVPSVTDALLGGLRSIARGPVLLVETDSPLPIRLDVEEPRTVGADRIVNTLAASQLYRRDTIVVDLGTATTYDCITADGVFLGGIIAPGVQAGQDWLSGRTAKLPRVELRPPERVIGRRTEACLQSGIFYSAVDAVDGIVDRIRKEWGREEALVVATGGYASVLAPYSRTVEKVEPLLTLLGLALAGRHVAEVQEEGVDSL